MFLSRLTIIFLVFSCFVALGDAAEIREVRVVSDGEQQHLESSIERLLERGAP